jgi:hypothetical protein
MTPGELPPQVNDEVRQLAAARPTATRSTPRLVNEARLKLIAHSFVSKTDFINTAAVAMPRILVE